MSYSNCLKCDTTVSSYQKYCPDCAKEYKQDNSFWKRDELKSDYNSSARESEIEEHLSQDKI